MLWFLLWGALAGCSAVPRAGGFVSQKELECFSQEKLYDEATDKCYKLLTSGPCPRGHWFVLEKPRETLRGDSEATIRGVCVREICKDGEYYWTSTNSCVKAKDKKRLCGDGQGQELLTNVFGEAECACARNPPRARLNDDRRRHCYLLYTRGPCPAAQVLGSFVRCHLEWWECLRNLMMGPCESQEIGFHPGFVGSSEQATCIPDPCYAESLYRKKQGLLSKDGSLAVWHDGVCHELGTRGPCPEGLTFKVHSSYLKPACVSLTNNLFHLEKSRNCFEDEEGRCQKQVHQRRRRPGCGSLLNHIFGGVNGGGCDKDENGVCQKKAAQKKRSTADKFMRELQDVLKKKK